MIELFMDKHAFWDWLNVHVDDQEGIWIRFDKFKKTSSLTPKEAVDVALCFGWIDGQLRSEGDQFYIKYFTKRRPQSIWSTVNKTNALRLIKEGLMMKQGFDAIDAAKKDGRWEKADQPPIDFDMEGFKKRIEPHEIAYQNYIKMSSSIQKIYAISYYALKKEESRVHRLDVIIDRLNRNLKPM